eukprot:GHRR01025115.1.p1 GENE.GHRR01025115.1~~GHRR01025115.1.p1  ORF type:complete len:140 (+),score=10.68 GHRR01025115.1:124-543(+)
MQIILTQFLYLCQQCVVASEVAQEADSMLAGQNDLAHSVLQLSVHVRFTSHGWHASNCVQTAPAFDFAFLTVEYWATDMPRPTPWPSAKSKYLTCLCMLCRFLLADIGPGAPWQCCLPLHDGPLVDCILSGQQMVHPGG